MDYMTDEGYLATLSEEPLPPILATMVVYRGEQEITVSLAEGGERFPWAIAMGRVILGPPDGTFTHDGIALDSLSWNINDCWVTEAVDAEGNDVQLTPEEYAQVVGAV